MDDLFKRGLLTYVGATALLWLVSWGMEANHAAHAWNPAWGLVSGLLNFFTWMGVIGAVGFVGLSVMANISARKDQGVREEEARRERELARIADRKRQQKLAHDQAVTMKRAKQEELLRQKEYEERQRKEKLEKLNRSARDATTTALDDF